MRYFGSKKEEVGSLSSPPLAWSSEQFFNSLQKRFCLVVGKPFSFIAINIFDNFCQTSSGFFQSKKVRRCWLCWFCNDVCCSWCKGGYRHGGGRPVSVVVVSALFVLVAMSGRPQLGGQLTMVVVFVLFLAPFFLFFACMLESWGRKECLLSAK